MINFSISEDKDREIANVCNKICELIIEEKVKPEDIMVICLEKRAKDTLTSIQSNLYNNEIRSLIPGITEDPTNFIVEDYVTLTTSRLAKGNEVPVVFVVGADSIYIPTSLADKRIARNALFISLSRAKGWAFLSGSGENAIHLKNEYKLIQEKMPKMEFVFPEEEDYDNMGRIDYLFKTNTLEETMRKADDLLKILGDDDQIDMLNLVIDEKTKALLRKLIKE